MSTPELRPARSLGASALVLLGLTGPAVVQPLYQLVSRYPEFFVAHRATWADILALSASLSIVLPLLGVGCVWLAGRVSRRLQNPVVDTLVAFLVALFAIQALKQTGVATVLAAWPLVILSLALGIVAAVAHARSVALQTFGAFLAAGAVVLPSLFVLQPAIWKIAFPERIETTGSALEHADTPVVLIVFDQIPVSSLMNAERRIDVGLYPNFAALADDGTWYRNASAVGNKSAGAVPAILTGQYPDPSKRLPSWLDYPDNLFSLVHPRYSMRVEEPITQLCPREVCGSTAMRLSFRVRAELADLAVVYAHVVAPQSWSSRLPPLTDNWKDFGVSLNERVRREYSQWREDHTRWDWTKAWIARRDADRRVGFNQFLAGIGSERQPALYFAHVLLPHEPYEFLPSGRSYMLDRGRHALEPNERWVDEPSTIRDVYQRHLLQLAHVDNLLGRLIAKLKETGLYERSLIVVTADHGASFVPGESFKDPTASNYADILSVPLLVKSPYQSGGLIDDRNAETIDVLPTIADVLGVDVSWSVDGDSLLGEPDPQRQQKIMLFGGAHGRRTDSAADVVASRNATIDRKLQLFGPAGDPLRRGASALDQQLVGRRVDEFRRGDDGSVNVILDYPAIFSAVDLESDFLPARVSGRVTWPDDTADDDRGVELAVALNGRISATTQVTSGTQVARQNFWTAILPEEAFLQGTNYLEVFAVESTPSGPLLRLAYEGIGDVADPVNIVMPTAERLHGVQLSGFRVPERTRDGVLFRWAMPSGTLLVPVDPDNPPVGLDIFVRHVNTRGLRLRIQVNGCLVFRRRVRSAFRERIAFGDCPAEGSELLLELIGDKLAPEAGLIGVGVSSIVLLDESAWQE
jgi:hypothetical protein